MIPRTQLRMSVEELDRYLARQRTLRPATTDDDGVPHVVPLWFVWHGGAVWLNSLRPTRRHRHLLTGRPVGLVVDDGDTYQRSYETIRIVPDEIASWDFAKIPSGRDAKVGLDETGSADQLSASTTPTASASAQNP